MVGVLHKNKLIPSALCTTLESKFSPDFKESTGLHSVSSGASVVVTGLFCARRAGALEGKRTAIFKLDFPSERYLNFRQPGLLTSKVKVCLFLSPMPISSEDIPKREAKKTNEDSINISD